jgi:hypothetical protein
MNDAADINDAAGMDVQHAAVIMQEARKRAQRELQARHPVLFATWGLAVLICYGAVWLSVRGQQPYHGPTVAAAVTVILVAAFAVAVAVVLVGRAVSGVGGWSVLQRRILFMSVGAAYAGLFTMEGALAHAGASRPVIAVYGAAAPLLVIGLAYAASAAVWLDWPVFDLGIWLIAVAAASGYAGPVTVWAIDGLAGGLAFLLVAAIRLVRSRS